MINAKILNSVFYNAHDAMSISHQGILIAVNPMYIKLFGYSDEKELLEKPAINLIEPYSRDLIVEATKNQLIASEGFILSRGIRKNGDTFDIELSLSRMEVDAEIYVLTVIKDITKDVKKNKVLEESQQRYKKLVELSPNAVCVHTKGLFVYVNPSAVTLFGGITESEIIGKPFIDFVHPDYRGLVLERVRRSLAVVETTKPTEEKFIRLDGKIIYVEAIGTAIIYDGQPSMLVVITDITERKEAENKLKQANEELILAKEDLLATNEELKTTTDFLRENEMELTKQNSKLLELNQEYEHLNENLTQSNNKILETQTELLAAKEKAEESDRLKSAFLANMSHEIRTPMNAILGFSEFLKDNTLEEDKREQFIEIINNSSSQLLMIINDIIDISKIEAGQASITYNETNLNQIFRDVHDFFSYGNLNFNGNALKMGTLLSNEESKIMTDEVKIRQILTNLINNALKFTFDGEVEFGYKLENYKDEQLYLTFYVRDTGIGISEEVQKIIFERFRQADENTNRKYGGTGLGLSICKAYIEMMEGNIWVESKTDMGSTFYFSIPYLPTRKKQVAEPNTVPSNKSDFHWKSSIILVAEDELFNFQLISEMLGRTNLEIIHAENGKIALEICQSLPDIALILMDIKMPEMDGFDATRAIKSFCPNLPIIAVTAYALAGDQKKAIDSGCDAYISKPINQLELFKLLDKYLRI